ncbi:DUF6222 family protein [Saccharothrix hoggarensis]|uniref:DUF6222 family protein n=1 Tax=Saccharothrix hoggarensis TaxID=913853 RepID=A0ABW3R679_9PSEU
MSTEDRTEDRTADRNPFDPHGEPRDAAQVAGDVTDEAVAHAPWPLGGARRDVPMSGFARGIRWSDILADIERDERARQARTKDAA